MAEVVKMLNSSARSVAKTFRKNRPLQVSGISLLAIGAGFGIWALIRKLRHGEGSEAGLYASEEMRRSGTI